jgi:hypothetical protein
MNTQPKQQFGHNERVSLEKHKTSVEAIDAIGDDHHAVLTYISVLYNEWFANTRSPAPIHGIY